MDEVIKGIKYIGSLVSSVITILNLLIFSFTLYSLVTGIFPVLYRIGIGLTKRKIALFAEAQFTSLRGLLVDSGLFKEKNIIQIDKTSINKAEGFSLFIVYWSEFKDNLDTILQKKKDNTPLIIYAPQDKEKIDQGQLEKINLHRNVIVVNFRGRLINDILVSLITTGFKK